MNDKFQTVYGSLNFGTTVTTADYQNVEVVVDPMFMMGEYAEAIVHDLERRNPIRFASVEKQMSVAFEGQTMIEVMTAYMCDLARIRIAMIHDNFKDVRTAKELAMTPYVQFAISLIGVVRDLDHGRKLVPCIGDPDLSMTMAQLLKVTEYLRVFESDGVVLLYDAFPRTKDGDQETMSYAIIDGYIKSIDRNSNPAKSYVAAFLGMKLRQESELKCLYSVRYDNVEYVRDRLIAELMK